MKFLDKIHYSFQKIMVGRNGADRLSLAMMWLGFALILISTFVGSYILNFIALAIYMLSILRVFSRKLEKRRAENQYYVQKVGKIRTSVTHRRNRFKMRKQYRYFKCPECKSWLRLPRGAGKVKVTCGQCGHQFSYISK